MGNNIDMVLKQEVERVCTDWAQATTNLWDALMGLISCLDAGKNAWIEVQKNGNQRFPVMKKNSLLDNPFNWTASYGLPRSQKAIEKEPYFNETQKDLTDGWVACFGKEKAILAYQQQNVISEEMFTGNVCHPVRIKDADYYREHIKKDNYHYGYWMNCWKPKDDIPYHVIDEGITDVFVICYDSGPVDKRDAMEKAGRFLLEAAKI